MCIARFPKILSVRAQDCVIAGARSHAPCDRLGWSSPLKLQTKYPDNCRFIFCWSTNRCNSGARESRAIKNRITSTTTTATESQWGNKRTEGGRWKLAHITLQIDFGYRRTFTEYIRAKEEEETRDSGERKALAVYYCQVSCLCCNYRIYLVHTPNTHTHTHISSFREWTRGNSHTNSFCAYYQSVSNWIQEDAKLFQLLFY